MFISQFFTSFLNFDDVKESNIGFTFGGYWVGGDRSDTNNWEE